MSDRYKMPYWLAGSQPLRRYPWLAEDENCEYLVLGGGMTGSLLAYRLAQSGARTCLITEQPVGYGGCAYGTGILEYDGNFSFVQLGKRIGRGAASRCLQNYRQALEDVEALCAELGEETGCERCDLLSFAAGNGHEDYFHTEYLLRRHNGYSVEYLDKTSARERYPFPVGDGVLSKGLAAVLDPYRFCQALVKQACKQYGLRCFERTRAVDVDLSHGKATVTTDTLHKVEADCLVLATGMDQNEYLHRYISKKTSFLVVTKPVKGLSGYGHATVLRGEEGSGFHIRALPDDRLLISGADSLLGGGDHRLMKLPGNDRLEELHAAKLLKILQNIYYGAEELEADHCSVSVYGCTADMLPVIGRHEEYDHVFFCMESGPENPLTAQIAAQQLLSGEEEALYSPHRKHPLLRRTLFGA